MERILIRMYVTDGTYENGDLATDINQLGAEYRLPCLSVERMRVAGRHLML